MLTVFKTVNRPTWEYGSPVWSQAASATGTRNLQCIQNAALRIVTGSHTMASMTHLHEECMVLPVREHLDLLSSQYLLACHQKDHPGQRILAPIKPKRALKPTLFSAHRDKVLPLLENEDTPISREAYRGLLKTLHRQAVTAAVDELEPSKVLGARPPLISSSEETLPRKARCTLSQLRSGYSRFLNTYKAVLDHNTNPACPLCSSHPHTTNHLFNCPSNPTTLIVFSLWEDPVEAALFLELPTDPPERPPD
jgi:hypothetical protein